MRGERHRAVEEARVGLVGEGVEGAESVFGPGVQT